MTALCLQQSFKGVLRLSASGRLATACIRWMPILNRTFKGLPRRPALRRCTRSLSSDGRLDGTAWQTWGTHQRSFVPNRDQPIVVVGTSAAFACFAALAVCRRKRLNWRFRPNSRRWRKL